MSKNNTPITPKPPKILTFDLDYPITKEDGTRADKVKMGRLTLGQMLAGQKFSDDEVENTLYSIAVCTANADDPWTVDDLKKLDPSDGLVLIKDWTVFTQGRAKTLEQES